MITLKSSTKEYLDLCILHAGCIRAMEPISMRASQMKEGEDSIEEGLKIYMENKEWLEGWSVWTLMKFGKELCPEIRKIHIDKIETPMMAMDLYLKCDHLTDDEDQLLEGKFRGKLPTAEKELQDKKVIRLKDGNN